MSTPRDFASSAPLEGSLEKPLHRTRLHEPIVIYVLIGLAVFAGVATLVGALATAILLHGATDVPAGWRILALTILLAGGLSALGVLLAVVAMIRRLERLNQHTAALEQHTAIQAEQAARRESAEPHPPGKQQEVLMLMSELREALLLPEHLRESRFQQLLERELERTLDAVRLLADARDFHRARQRLAALIERFGPHERITLAQAQLDKDAHAAQQQDIAQTRQRLQELMTANQWDQAERQARELADKYPDAQEPLGYIEHICRERQLFEQRNRARMHNEIQQFVHARRWQEAARATKQFMETFPVGADTEALRTQLETLQANAEIQTRQQLEQQIKERIQNHQYWDALALARQIIADYPFSPQANALRAQVARLEELARTQKA